MTEHTPTPWMVTGKQTIRAGAKFSAVIGKTNWRNGEANAAFIVRVVNSHAALVKALRELAAEAHINMTGGKGHLLDNAYAALALANKKES